ncbi:MAG: TIM barrel protein [Chloroflexota bacterium]
MAMHVGTASVNWGFDPLYTWVTTPSFDQLLDEMAESGYEGTEISYNFPMDIPSLRADLTRHGLRAAATFHEVSLLDPRQHDDAIAGVIPVADRLQALGSDTLILSDHTSPHRLAVAGRVGPDDGLDDARWQALATGLNRIGALLRERGMHAVFHPHVGTYVETRAEIDRLCALTDPDLVGLCPDTGHLAYAGVDPEAIFVDYAQRVKYVHLKDVDAAKLEQVRAEHLDFAAAVKRGLFVPLGAGMVNMDRIFGALRGTGYAGWMIVEQDAPADPLAAARHSRAYLRDRFGV